MEKTVNIAFVRSVIRTTAAVLLGVGVAAAPAYAQHMGGGGHIGGGGGGHFSGGGHVGAAAAPHFGGAAPHYSGGGHMVGYSGYHAPGRPGYSTARGVGGYNASYW